MSNSQSDKLIFGILALAILAGCQAHGQSALPAGYEEWDYKVYGKVLEPGTSVLCTADQAALQGQGWDQYCKEHTCEIRKLYGKSFCLVDCEGRYNFTVDMSLNNPNIAIPAQTLVIEKDSCTTQCYGEFKGYTCGGPK